MKNSGSDIAAFVICTLIGVSMIFLARYNYKTGKEQKTRCTRTAKGKVVDADKDRDFDNGHISYYHIYSYVADGETYSIRSKRGSRKYNPERVVNIFYDPNDPKFAYVEGQEGKKSETYVLLLHFCFWL